MYDVLKLFRFHQRRFFFDFIQAKGTFDHRYMLEIQELRITNVNIYKTTCIMNVCKVYRIHTL